MKNTAKITNWFLRTGGVYWKLFQAGSKDKLAQFWPSAETGSDSPEAGLEALEAELGELEPGRYILQACPGNGPKDTANHFKLPFTVPRESEPAPGPAPAPVGFGEKGIFGHPDVIRHIEQVKEMAAQKYEIELLKQKIQGIQESPATAATGSERAMTHFFTSLAPYTPAIVAAITGGKAAATPAPAPAPDPAPAPPPPVNGNPDSEAAIIREALRKMRQADPQYFLGIKTLAEFAAKNPEGFKTLLSQADQFLV